MAALATSVLWKQGTFGRVRSAAETSSAPRPEDAVYQAFDAVLEGDLHKYLAAHTGVMESSLSRAIEEMGEAGLLRSLQERNATLKGLAIAAPEFLSDREARASVESIFVDRNEHQMHYFVIDGGGWKIIQVERSEHVETLIPYGTSVR